MPALIHLENVHFTYPNDGSLSNAVLTNFTLTIHAGEFVALIGANGSGKSTLAKLLNALLLPERGRVLISGMDTREYGFHPLIRSQVGLVFQRPQHQIVATTVEEDTAFGPGNLGLESAEIKARVDDALLRTGLEHYRQRLSFQLSAGETQRLALAGVLAMRPRCVIFDETTAMLDPIGREMVMAQIRDLNRQGITIILITHLMQEAAQAERVIVLHKGEIVSDDSPSKIFSSDRDLPAIGLDLPPATMAALKLIRFFPDLQPNTLSERTLLESLPGYSGEQSHSRSTQHSTSSNQPIVSIDDLSFTYMAGTPLSHLALDHLNLQVDQGKVHALIGATGAGKSTILQHINGLYRPQSGRVLVAGLDTNDSRLDIMALRRKAALAFQQPEDQIFEQYVGDEIAYAPRHLGYQGRLEDVVRSAMQATGLDFGDYKDRLTSTLSGGEKRKVALASILAIQADILLLDEPLSGLDPQASREFLQTIDDQKKAGKTILVSTHQYEEILPLIDWVSAINNGKDCFHGNSEFAFSQIEALEQIGLRAPLPARIAARLIQLGWPIMRETATFASLEHQLANLTSRGAA
jgi:energy-coupling factor transporter ATPase